MDNKTTQNIGEMQNTGETWDNPQQPAQAISQPPTQPINQPPIQPINQQMFQQTAQPIFSTANNNQTQPTNQPPVQPTNQPPVQPVSQQMFQQAPQLMSPVSNNDNQNPKKKIWIIIGCSAGAVAVIALGVFLVFALLINKEKIVSCDTIAGIEGFTLTKTTNIKIGDGEILGGDVYTKVDLGETQNDFINIDTLAKQIESDYETNYKEHCTLDYKNVGSNSAKYTMVCDKEGISDIVRGIETENKSAQEIADKAQELMESPITTCKQK